MSDKLGDLLKIAAARGVIEVTGKPQLQKTPQGTNCIIPVKCDGKATVLMIETIKL